MQVEKILQELIRFKNGQLSLNHAADAKRQLSKQTFMEEFSTIMFDPGRMTGKTTAIKGSATPRDIILGGKYSVSQEQTHAQVCRSVEVFEAALQQRNTLDAMTIFIDEPKVFFKDPGSESYFNRLISMASGFPLIVRVGR